MSRFTQAVIFAGVIALTASLIGFLATHHQESYNCHRTADMVKMCDFRYKGNK